MAELWSSLGRWRDIGVAGSSSDEHEAIRGESCGVTCTGGMHTAGRRPSELSVVSRDLLIVQFLIAALTL